MSSNVRSILYEVFVLGKDMQPVDNCKVILMDNQGTFLFPGDGLNMPEEDFVFFSHRAGGKFVELVDHTGHTVRFTIDASVPGSEHLYREVPVPEPVKETISEQALTTSNQEIPAADGIVAGPANASPATPVLHTGMGVKEWAKLTTEVVNHSLPPNHVVVKGKGTDWVCFFQTDNPKSDRGWMAMDRFVALTRYKSDQEPDPGRGGIPTPEFSSFNRDVLMKKDFSILGSSKPI